jgi:hypothetical protein
MSKITAQTKVFLLAITFLLIADRSRKDLAPVNVGLLLHALTNVDRSRNDSLQSSVIWTPLLSPQVATETWSTNTESQMRPKWRIQREHLDVQEINIIFRTSWMG